MMKNYHIYVFTKDGCPPCDQLKDEIEKLTDDQKAELDVVPIVASNGKRTALAEELNVELTPTLVVTNIGLQCEIDFKSDDEFCSQEEESVERFVGAKEIIKNLRSTLDSYTYANSPE